MIKSWGVGGCKPFTAFLFKTFTTSDSFLFLKTQFQVNAFFTCQ